MGDLRGLVLVAVVWLVTACSSPASSTPEPTERPTPEPTLKPWSVDVMDAQYTTRVGIGDTITIDVKLKNTGAKRSPATVLNFSELDKYADIDECKPGCEIEDLPGLGPSAVLPGVPTGRNVTFHVEFVAAKVGVVRWSVCAFDNRDYAESVWCGDGKTTIR